MKMDKNFTKKQIEVIEHYKRKRYHVKWFKKDSLFTKSNYTIVCMYKPFSCPAEITLKIFTDGEVCEL